MAARAVNQFDTFVASIATPPGLQPALDAPVVGGGGATMGSIYGKASREFIETEILVNFDQMIVDVPDGENDSG